MKELKKFPIGVSFNDEEYQKVIKAISYTSLNKNIFMRMLLHQSLGKLEKEEKEKGTLTLTFFLDEQAQCKNNNDKKITFRSRSDDYEIVKRLSKSTPFSMSSIVKFCILPLVDQIIKEKKWEGRV